MPSYPISEVSFSFLIQFVILPSRGHSALVRVLKYINLEDGFFHQESTLLINPPSLLRGQVKNRWESVHKDPMQNILEPFNRLGEDTYLSTMDTDDTCDK